MARLGREGVAQNGLGQLLKNKAMRRLAAKRRCADDIPKGLKDSDWGFNPR